MGYRSDWRLVFNTAGRANEVLGWLKAEATNTQNGCHDFIEEMLGVLAHSDDDVVIFEDEYWKLYDWDVLTSLIEEKWGDDDEVDFAWAVVGEEYDDIQVRSGDYTYISISRVIDDNDIGKVPKKDVQAQVAVAPPPLKCTCGGFGNHSSWCDLITGKHSEGAYS